jgi:putative membrane protein
MGERSGFPLYAVSFPMGEGRFPSGLKPDFSGFDVDRLSALLSSRRTQLSLHRTRMSADRTLMSVVRTSLSLIGFGFTIFQFFRYLRQSVEVAQKIPIGGASHLGMTLVLLGVALLVLGIWDHVKFMLHLRAMRRELGDAGLIQAEDTFPLSTTLVVATLLLVTGIASFVYMLGRTAGP